MKPKVAVVLPPRESFSAAGGGAISLVVHRLAAASRDEFDPFVIAPESGLPPFDDVQFCPVRVAFWPPASRAARYAASVAGVLSRLQPAMIEVHNRPDVALILSRRFASLPTVLFLHNDPAAMRAGRSASERRRLLVRLAKIVTVSQFLRIKLLDGIEDTPRAVVLPNPVVCADFSRRLLAEAREPVLLFAGRMVRDKGADAFVEAAAEALPRLCGWRAEMFGADRFGPASPTTRYLTALSRRARSVGTELHGYRPQTEVLEAMGRAAITVVPSRWAEPFGLAALEAMAAGCALIAAPRGALPEVAGDAACYADPDKPGELAAAMVALARDPAARQALGERGRARADKFDIAHVARALGSIRREVLRS
ncbi:MAG: glycosyltransferase family 4 protein [Acetobacteraceae bacterium]